MEQAIEKPKHSGPEPCEVGTGPPNVYNIPSLATTPEAPIGWVQTLYPAWDPVPS